MNECTVPKWNLRNQRQELIEEEEEEEESNRSFHMHAPFPQNPTASKLVPMSNYEVAELTWENGQLGMHGLSGLLHSGSRQTKSLWENTRTSETLESIVHQATCQNSSGFGKWAEASSSGHHLLMKKRSISEQSNQCATSGNGSLNKDEAVDLRTRGSASENTMDITWSSFESPPSYKPKSTLDDSASHGGSETQDEDRETKTETLISHSSRRRSRAAAVHNLSERRRRDRINQKMKALQKLVPNASKTDKASMLDEVIEYLKQLQAQVQVMSARKMPQMMMSLAMQHQLQMSLLARMGTGVGLGMGMGMLDFNSIPNTTLQSLPPLLHPTPAASATTPTFVPHPFLVPSLISAHAPAPADQSMNMEAYNKMAALYLQQVNQATQAASSLSQLSRVQGDN